MKVFVRKRQIWLPYTVDNLGRGFRSRVLFVEASYRQMHQMDQWTCCTHGEFSPCW